MIPPDPRILKVWSQKVEVNVKRSQKLQTNSLKRVFDRLREECTIMLQPGIFILLSMSA